MDVPVCLLSSPGRGTTCPLAKQELKEEINEHKMGPTAFPIPSLEEARGSGTVTTSTLKGPLWAP